MWCVSCPPAFPAVSCYLPATHCFVPPVAQYALSAWPPSKPENWLLIFPHNGLTAVFFYGPGGMPELPRPQDHSPVPRANPVASASVSATTTKQALIKEIFSQMTPEQQAMFRQMPLAKRKMIITTLLARLNQSREQWQQIQAQMSNANQQQHLPAHPLLQPQGPNTVFFGMGMPGSQRAVMGGAQDMHGSTPSGNVPGDGPDVDNLCCEMLQLLM